MQRGAKQLVRRKSGTAGALSDARDLLAVRGMHGRAQSLQKLSELVWARRSQQHIVAARLSSRLQQARPSGERS